MCSARPTTGNRTRSSAWPSLRTCRWVLRSCARKVGPGGGGCSKGVNRGAGVQGPILQLARCNRGLQGLNRVWCESQWVQAGCTAPVSGQGCLSGAGRAHSRTGGAGARSQHLWSSHPCGVTQKQRGGCKMTAATPCTEVRQWRGAILVVACKSVLFYPPPPLPRS
jgi:hypothetical protein